jgi:Uma2 family endonuclease
VTTYLACAATGFPSPWLPAVVWQAVSAEGAMATAPPVLDAPPPLPLRRWSLREYHQMIDLGLLTEDDRVELLEGWIVAKMPHNPPHDSTVAKLDKLLTRLLSDDWSVRCQCSVTLKAGRGSEPEPDLVVVRGPDELYDRRHPGPADTALVVEVSDSTIEHDCGFKKQVYARARLPVYWIVSIVDRRVEVYTRPRGGRNPTYLRQTDFPAGSVVPVILFGEAAADIPVDSFLPRE